jgi:hypothetical protein
MPQLLDPRFTELVDTPKDYEGNEGKIVRVNAAATQLEFVSPADLDLIESFLDLSDTPATYTGAAFKIVTVTSAENGLEFVDAATLVGGSGGNLASPTAFTDLTDTPANYTGADNKFVRVAGSSLAFEDITFLDLADTPATYSGQGGKQVAVNTSADGLIFVSATDSFISLTDTPNAYVTVDAGKVVRVNTSANGLVFSDYTFTALLDTPDNYVGAANAVVKVNGAANALVFANEIDTFVELTDTPSAYTSVDGGKLVRVKADLTGLEFASPEDVVATSFAFTDLTDAPTVYQVSDVGKYVQVKADSGDGKRLQFAEASAIAAGLPSVIIELKLYDENYTTGTQPVATGVNAVAIGEGCVASGANSNVAGGRNNTASGQYAVVAGGNTNTAAGQGSTITGGQSNTISSGTWHSVISGTGNSIANNSHCGIIGGQNNIITGVESSYSIIMGGLDNRIETSLAYGTLRGSTIIGGKSNSILRDNSLIAGGENNTVTAPECLILGGANNQADGDYGTIVGGIYGTTRQLYNAQVFGTQRAGQTTVGKAQTTVFLLSNDSNAGGGFTRLLLDGGVSHGGRQNVAGGYINRVRLPASDFTYLLNCWVVGRSLTGAESAAFELQVMIRLNAGVAQTPCSVTKTTVCKTTGASAWDVRLIVAPGTAGVFTGNFVDIEVDGGSNNVRWVARMETLELVI